MMKAAVIGNPIAHSKSPRLHNHWLSISGVKGRYERVFSERDEFDPTIRDLISKDYRGANVTLPFKEEAAAICAERSPFVEQNGAANTLVFEDGMVKGHNTDGYGFAQNIWDHYPDWNAKGDHVVLGAGGAAKAIVAWLVNAGAHSIVIINRNQTRAVALRALSAKIDVRGWDDLPEILAGKTTLINTTSLGMKGQNDIQIDFAHAPRDLIVNDIVYTPLITGLLKSAQNSGLRIVDGLGMLLWQARPGFHAWFGVEAPKIDEGLRNFMLSDQVLAITGSIGMGKTTVTNIFAKMGYSVWRADEEVDRLYAGNDELYSFIKSQKPEALEGKFQKSIWRDHVFAHPEIFPALEAIIHREIAKSRRVFLESKEKRKICDIPLLFETGSDALYDKVIAVKASPETQRKRVMARGTMTRDQFEDILKKQWSSDAKCAAADFVIDNDGSLMNTKEQVIDIINKMDHDHA